jgi:hypothetical protein
VTWPKADLPKIPEHWRFVGSRQSPLSGGPRLAVTQLMPSLIIASPCSKPKPGLRSRPLAWTPDWD